MAAYFAALPGGLSLDFVFTRAAAIQLLDGLSPGDVHWHRMGTLIGDTVLPLAYGTATMLAILRYARGGLRIALAVMIFAGVGLDFLENALHIELLRGDLDVLGTHIFVTWAKFTLVVPPIVYGLVNWLFDWRQG